VAALVAVVDDDDEELVSDVPVFDSVVGVVVMTGGDELP